MKVTIVHDDVHARADAPEDERGVLEAVDAVRTALCEDHQVETLPIGRSVGWIAQLERMRPDVVFNLCEGVAGSSAGEVHVAGVLSLLRLPMTGSGADALALARRKDRVNAVLTAAGLDVPAWAVANGRHPDWHAFPAIVKPVSEDASVGIRQRSIVRDAVSLRAALERGPPDSARLIQSFIDGREFNVAFVGATALPIAEIDFSAMPEGMWPIVSYDAKWSAGSTEDQGTRPVCPAPIDAVLAGQLLEVGRRAWSLVDDRGYARIDLRLADNGRICVLDVNPNPDLAPAAGLARAAAAGGWRYAELVRRILDDAAIP